MDSQPLLSNALGTTDQAFALGLIEQLKAISVVDGRVSEANLNFMASIVKGVESRDQAESMLAAHMAVIHKLMFDLSVSLPQCMAPQQSLVLSTINKLARTYAIQLEALKRYRSKGEQKVLVQHVNVSEGGQAIVGDIHQQQKETANAASSPPALTQRTSCGADR
jgi:hypothetical protein